MTSVTLPRRAHNLQFIREHQNYRSSNTDDEEAVAANNTLDNHHRYFPKRSKLNKSSRAISCDERDLPPSTANTRLSHLCSKLKRRFVLSKENRTQSEDVNETTPDRRMTRLGNYESFSSSTDDPLEEFTWPDFEQVYDTIPPCLINALPGLDDFSIEEKYQKSANQSNVAIDEYSTEQTDLFIQCKRGKSFRRNAICHKLDKSQYNSQLDTFVQQLMVEKLMRTWT